MPLVPGALLAIGLQTVLGFGYAFYVKQAGDGGAYQAGLATIGVTLMALYLFSVALLVGVEVNRTLGERRLLGERADPGREPAGALRRLRLARNLRLLHRDG